MDTKDLIARARAWAPDEAPARTGALLMLLARELELARAVVEAADEFHAAMRALAGPVFIVGAQTAGERSRVAAAERALYAALDAARRAGE
jgi:hypothetical protein